MVKARVFYSAEVKEHILSKVFAPNAPSVVALSKEFNIPLGTLYKWVLTMRRQHNQSSKKTKDPSVEAKLQAVIDTAHMTQEEQAAYCRQHGLYAHQLLEWKHQFLNGFQQNSLKKESQTEKILQNENNQLKKELHKKDKALAEVSALLILKKKADLIWGIKEEDD